MAADLRVLIVDDHPVVRQGLRLFLGTQPGVIVVDEAGDGREAIESAARTQPDVILLDLSMPVMGGLAALAGLRQASPGSHILILTSATSDEAVLPAMRGGASGFVVKDAAPADVVLAIRTVAAGGSYLAPAAARRVLHELHAPASPTHGGAAPRLTPRERDVLALIAQGLANKAIATRLSVSDKTVKTHVSSVLMKLGVSDRTQAALWAVEHR